MMAAQIDDGARVRICSSGWQVPTWAVGSEGVVERQTRSGNFVVRLDALDTDRASLMSAKPAQVEPLALPTIDSALSEHGLAENAVEKTAPDGAPSSLAPLGPLAAQLGKQATSSGLDTSSGSPRRQRTPTERVALLLTALVVVAGLLWAIVPYSTEMPALGRQQRCQDWGGAIAQVIDHDQALAKVDELEDSNATLADELLTGYLRAAMGACQEAASARLRLSSIASAGGILMSIGLLALGRQGATLPDSAYGEDPVEQIRRLAELREAGAITDSDFELRKQALLRHLE